jgi:hypothetical protein
MGSDPVVINDSYGHERVRIGEIVESLDTGGSSKPGSSQTGSTTAPTVHPDWWGMVVKNPAGDDVVEIGRGAVSSPLVHQGGTAGPPPTATAAFGGGGFDGQMQLRTDGGETAVDATIGPLVEGTPAGVFSLGHRPVALDVGGALLPGTISATAGEDYVVHVRSFPPGIDMVDSDKTRLRIEGDGSVWLGGNGVGSDIYLFDQSGDNTTAADAALHIRGASPGIGMTFKGKPTVRVGGPEGEIWLGGNGTNGTILLFDGQHGDNVTKSVATIVIDGGKGDIILQNADFAEDFTVADAEAAEAGTVLVIGDDGLLRPSEQAYDRRVAGVVSGAANCQPGIILGRASDASNRHPIALVGRVFCKAEAHEEVIAVGDLLTTSATPGHAMKASDPSKAFGAVLGKALAPLKHTTGLIPILVTLQ